MASPLIPTPIVNKLGIATTVHRRADAAPASHSSLPAPGAVSTQLTPKELEAQRRLELRERIAEVAVPEVDHDEKSNYMRALQGTDNLDMETLETLARMIDDPPRYRSYLLQHMKRELINGETYKIALQASLHDIANASFDAGNKHAAVSVETVDNYFGRQRIYYLKNKHVEDFKLWYLIREMELEDESIFGGGKIDYWRQMEQIGQHRESVVKALPIITLLIKKEFYGLYDNVDTIITIGKHVENRTPHEVSRIVDFIESREEFDEYDTYFLDDMLEQPDSALLHDGML
jgi:hypothetical protein